MLHFRAVETHGSHRINSNSPCRFKFNISPPEAVEHESAKAVFKGIPIKRNTAVVIVVKWAKAASEGHRSLQCT